VHSAQKQRGVRRFSFHPLPRRLFRARIKRKMWKTDAVRYGERKRVMKIKAAVFDIDGTLLPHGKLRVSPAVIQALNELRRQGVVVVIATGRALFSAHSVLRGVPADYLVTANGACVTDANDRTLHSECMTSEEMYALVDFCEDDEIPLSFTFPDGHYMYVEGQKMREIAGQDPNLRPFLRDGEDQVRHLEGMPCGATAFLTAEQVDAFTQKYGYLGLQFFPFAPDECDIVRTGVDKAIAVERLLQAQGIAWEQTAAFGDSTNDAQMLARAGVSVVMENGAAELKQTAQIVAPPCTADGVASVIAQWVAQNAQ
jgi:Cof subfamily protein (haloacid dehalogenase superfamily)